jgi:hypothetical protein
MLRRTSLLLSNPKMSCQCVSSQTYEGCSTSTVAVIVHRRKIPQCQHMDKHKVRSQHFQKVAAVSIDGSEHVLGEIITGSGETWTGLMKERDFVNLTAALYSQLTGQQCESSCD